MKVSLVTLTLSFITGVAIGILYQHASIVILFLLCIALLQVLLYLIILLKKLHEEHIGAIFWISLFCVFGILRGEMYEEVNLPIEFTQGKQILIAEIVSIPENKDTTQTFDVDAVSSMNKEQHLRLRITAPVYPAHSVGEVVQVSGVIHSPEILLPTDIGASNKSFDYKRYLHSKEIVGTMIFPSITKVGDAPNSFVYKLYRIKEKSETVLNKWIPSPESSLAGGVLLGTDTLPKENKDEVRIASLSHIIVLSGFNVAIIVTVVLFLLRFLPFFVRICISAVLIGGFVVMVGGGASLLRATVMAYMGLFALILGRRYDALTALFFALLVYIALIPEALLYDVSLQLSFLATLGIIVLYNDVENLIAKFVPYKNITSVLATTLSVMICTTPFLMYTFGTFSLYGIVANILALPLVPLLMASSFLLLCTAYIPIVSHILAFISYCLSGMILYIAKFISYIPFASLSISISLTTMYSMYIIILFCVLYIHYKKSLVTICVSEEDPTIVSF